MKRSLGISAGLIGIGTLSVMLSGCPDSTPPDKDTSKMNKFAALAEQCESAARQADSNAFDGRDAVSNNLNRYTEGEPFDLQVSVQGQGNTFLQINCRVDANGNVSYQNYEKAETVAGEDNSTDSN